MSDKKKKRKENPAKGKSKKPPLFFDNQEWANAGLLIVYLKDEVYRLRQELDALTKSKADEVPSDQADAQ